MISPLTSSLNLLFCWSLGQTKARSDDYLSVMTSKADFGEAVLAPHIHTARRSCPKQTSCGYLHTLVLQPRCFLASHTLPVPVLSNWNVSTVEQDCGDDSEIDAKIKPIQWQG